MELLPLDRAQTAFLDLLSKVDPSESMEFVEWVCQQCSEFLPGRNVNDETDSSSDDEKIEAIISDLRQIVPLEGVMSSENVNFPEVGHNAGLRSPTTVHIDAFLYDDEAIDRLCTEGKLSRTYCMECGSHKTKLLDFISHSMAPEELGYIFEEVLPTLLPSKMPDANLVDVGSRLGAVLYGAFYYSEMQNIYGIEINKELCDLQQQMINKYDMEKRVKVICADICEQGTLLGNADVVILNNVFEFFMPVDRQITTWKFLQSHITKRGCIIVTVPSLEQATALGKDKKPIVDLHSWVQPLALEPRPDTGPRGAKRSLESTQIFFYRVK